MANPRLLTQGMGANIMPSFPEPFPATPQFFYRGLNFLSGSLRQSVEPDPLRGRRAPNPASVEGYFFQNVFPDDSHFTSNA